MHCPCFNLKLTYYIYYPNRIIDTYYHIQRCNCNTNRARSDAWTSATVGPTTKRPSRARAAHTVATRPNCRARRPPRSPTRCRTRRRPRPCPRPRRPTAPPPRLPRRCTRRRRVRRARASTRRLPRHRSSKCKVDHVVLHVNEFLNPLKCRDFSIHPQLLFVV